MALENAFMVYDKPTKIQEESIKLNQKILLEWWFLVNY